ncbi:hypothetical protein FJTKL_12585, partial [Diaporthe vaccinii]
METEKELAVESSPLLTVYLHNAPRNPGAARATRLLPLKNNPSSNRPCPTCCTSHAVPVISACQLLVDVGHDNGVDGAGGVLGLGGPVTARVVLVLARAAGLPGAAGVGHLLLGGGGGG